MPSSSCWPDMKRRSTSSAMGRWPSYAIPTSGRYCNATLTGGACYGGVPAL